ncbi:Hsp20/alpha crystallin family protein [Virgibacillus sp. W0430]|uniref:Hsp20/alpha crystallin family protein n=1 Tax=Virgibacillus sp. W0430 TaxID=3391580 RepID=UPI003F48F3D8
MERNKGEFPAKRNQESPLNDFMERMDAFFHESFSNFNTFWNPKGFKVDMYETESAVIVEAILPGYTRDQVEIEIIGSNLRITVEDRASMEKVNEKEHYYKKEQSYRKAERLVALPFPISKNETKAAFKNGILKITVPKNNDSRSYVDIEHTSD